MGKIRAIKKQVEDGKFVPEKKQADQKPLRTGAISDHKAAHLAKQKSPSQSSFENDLKALKSQKGIEAKRAHKESVLLPKYEPEAERHVLEGLLGPNMVFVYVIIWLMDVGRITKAVEWGLIAIAQGQAMPEEFSRDLTDFLYYQYMEWLVEQLKNGGEVEPSFSLMLGAYLNGDVDIAPELAVKYLTKAAEQLFEAGDYMNALAFIVDGVLVLNPDAKVKTLKDKLEKALESSTGTGS